jgi:hypothetical protein
MNILFSPIRSNFNISYTFGNDSITAVIDGQSDTFDFSAMPNGVLDEITTTLNPNPIISAERKEGVLSVVLLNPIGEDATEAEKNPEWTVV